MGKIIVPGLRGLGKFPVPDLRPKPVAMSLTPNRIKILIGMPFGRPMDLLPIESWVALFIKAVTNPCYFISGKYVRTAYLDVNRDTIAAEALKQKTDFVLMVDTDMDYPDTTLDTLVSRDKDVVGVAYYTPRWNPEEKKSEEVWPQIYDYNIKAKLWSQWPMIKETEPFRVDAVGTGIMLIKTKVFKKLKKPWFPFFRTEYKGDPKVMGEDLGFCLKCLANGIEVWVDPTIDVGHNKAYRYSKKDCTTK